MISNDYKLKDNDFLIDGSFGEFIYKIRDLPIDNKPREKLIKQGPEALSVAELLAVVLNVGSKKEDVLAMSYRIIREYGEKSIVSEKNPEKLSNDLNIPIIKACQIIACGEMGRRFNYKDKFGSTVIRNARDVFDYLYDMRSLPKEHLRGLYLNSHNRIIHDEVISIGTINVNIAHPREVFRPAIEYSSGAIVLAHNHPSGVCTPSAQDIEITEQLIKAEKIIGINILDHVIITKDSFVSIKSNY
jgi:DNA repair protein RadC